ncbi:hypothetical protein CXG81DRAFT_16932 [Caulochytrium protostelioides]|uniref:Threonine/serine exporter-like N-terminal domain-containing protein n=1 Tax=Caulochytrium protostelioides TaxID=1555241 RepID=A0A4P9XDG9_9FUNG|nr:hypothetical protein CXG81DRAFT_16932 [Caulochytrium protostelioides]|eukprot:RKP03554.1 hypothetical protein CXG81DRAFT_16932 [Caulochytrium protostelioides]
MAYASKYEGIPLGRYPSRAAHQPLHEHEEEDDYDAAGIAIPGRGDAAAAGASSAFIIGSHNSDRALYASPSDTELQGDEELRSAGPTATSARPMDPQEAPHLPAAALDVASGRTSESTRPHSRTLSPPDSAVAATAAIGAGAPISYRSSMAPMSQIGGGGGAAAIASLGFGAMTDTPATVVATPWLLERERERALSLSRRDLSGRPPHPAVAAVMGRTSMAQLSARDLSGPSPGGPVPGEMSRQPSLASRLTKRLLPIRLQEGLRSRASMVSLLESPMRKNSTFNLTEALTYRGLLTANNSMAGLPTAAPSAGPGGRSGPGITRLQSLPWLHGIPKDQKHATLIMTLAKALDAYGAPLYRVEHRIIEVAEALNIPVSLFCLPATLMISIGDASSKHPCRMQFVPVNQAFHMGKLFRVDLLSKQAAGLGRMSRAGYRKTTRTGRHDLDVIKSSQSSFTDAIGAISTTSVVPDPSHIAIPMSATEIATKELEIDEILEKLNAILHEPKTLIEEVWVRMIASSLQSCCIAVLLLNGGIGDGVTSMILGALTGAGLWIGDKYALTGVIEIVVPLCVSIPARLAVHIPQVYGGTPLCLSKVNLASLAQLLPGVQITLGMLEMGSQNPVAGSVRIFAAFIKSIKMGYGISIGNRLSEWFLVTAGFNYTTGQCSAAPPPIVPWKLIFLPVMIGATIMNLRSDRSQWLHMAITSLLGFCAKFLSLIVFDQDVSAVISAFVIGFVANIYARRYNEIAIAPTLAGIGWLVPGSMGVKSALAWFSPSGPDASTGTSFGIDMIRFP